MKRSSASAGAAASLLLATLATGCATTDAEPVKPRVTLPDRPALDIDWFELCARMHSAEACEDPGAHDVRAFYDVQDQIDGLIDWGLELDAIIRRAADTQAEDD